jgi:hypothetical protein
MFSSVDGFSTADFTIPILRDPVKIITPLVLSQNPNPKVGPRNRKAWTRKHREEAERNAILASSLVHLTQLVESSDSVFGPRDLFYFILFFLAAKSSRGRNTPRRQLYQSASID